MTSPWIVLSLLTASAGPAGAPPARPLDGPRPVIGFAAGPTAVRDGSTVRIAFTLSAPIDVEVAMLDAGGQVVRHLAAGVLGGPHPPPPPLVPGLAQDLVWDGQDDFGKPAPGGALTVRVRAGMGARLGRFIGGDPYCFGDVDALAADEDGNLYVSGFGGPANQSQKTLRVFAPDGRYLRTILPFPADLPPDAMPGVARWDQAAGAWRPRNLNVLNPEFYSSENGYANYALVSASKTRGVLLVRRDGLARLDARGALLGPPFPPGQVPWPSDKFWPKTDEIAAALAYHAGPVLYAASPDGRYLYLAGPFPAKDRATPTVPPGSIWRMRLDGSDAKMNPFVVVPATPEGPWSRPGGRNYGASGPVHGLAVDLQGRVYVCDREKNRIVAFDESGKEIGDIPVANPDLVAVHPRTGALYVVRRFTNGWNTHEMVLEKFAGLGRGAAPVASYARFHRNNWPKMALLTDGERTRLWFTGVAAPDAPLKTHEVPKGFFVLDDRGAEFQAVALPHGPRPGAQEHFARIAVDPGRDEVYVSDGVNLLWRYRGATGEGALLTRAGRPFFAPDLTVGYDGLLYVRSGEGFSGPLERLTRDLEPVPFPDIGSNKLYDIYGRYGIGYCEKGVGVGPDGAVYDNWMYDFAKYFVSGWAPGGKPLAGRYLTAVLRKSKPVFLDVKLPDERKITGAIVGPVPAESGGIRVDLQGNLYLGMRVQPKGFVAPPGFEQDPAYLAFTGSVVKFGPAGGAVLGIADAESLDPAAPRLETARPGVVIEGGLALYPGVAPFSGAGYGGNTSCCVCRLSRFDLDRYGRLALPNVVTTSVSIVDNAGNRVIEFGLYGNFDSQYVPPEAGDGKPLVATPDIPLAWPAGAGLTDQSVYVLDTLNRRVVRADLTWQVEQRAAVK